MTHAQLTKLATLPGAILDPNGSRVGGVIEPGYTVRGHYSTPPRMGHPFVLDRYESNGVEVPGLFTTSPVVLLSRSDDGSIGLKTVNSIYRLTPL